MKVLIAGTFLVVLIALGCFLGPRIIHGRRASGLLVASEAEPSLPGSIDPSSLTGGSVTPTITGTYSGDAGVGIVVVTEGHGVPKCGAFGNPPGSVVVDCSDHGGMIELQPSGERSGKFSYTVSKALKRGSYTVGIYVYHNIYSEQGYEGDSMPELVARGTLVVK